MTSASNQSALTLQYALQYESWLLSSDISKQLSSSMPVFGKNRYLIQSFVQNNRIFEALSSKKKTEVQMRLDACVNATNAIDRFNTFKKVYRAKQLDWKVLINRFTEIEIENQLWIRLAVGAITTDQLYTAHLFMAIHYEHARITQTGVTMPSLEKVEIFLEKGEINPVAFKIFNKNIGYPRNHWNEDRIKTFFELMKKAPSNEQVFYIVPVHEEAIKNMKKIEADWNMSKYKEFFYACRYSIDLPLHARPSVMVRTTFAGTNWLNCCIGLTYTLGKKGLAELTPPANDGYFRMIVSASIVECAMIVENVDIKFDHRYGMPSLANDGLERKRTCFMESSLHRAPHWADGWCASPSEFMLHDKIVHARVAADIPKIHHAMLAELARNILKEARGLKTFQFFEAVVCELEDMEFFAYMNSAAAGNFWKAIELALVDGKLPISVREMAQNSWRHPKQFDENWSKLSKLVAEYDRFAFSQSLEDFEPIMKALRMLFADERYQEELIKSIECVFAKNVEIKNPLVMKMVAACMPIVHPNFDSDDDESST